MENQDSLDVFIDDVQHKYHHQSVSFGRKQDSDTPDLPIKALKLGLRLPSYIRKLENPSNAHDACKSRMSKQLTQDDSGLLKASITKARALMSKSNNLKAIELLEALVSKGISHSDVYYLLGEAYRLLENYSKSEEYLFKSLSKKIHPPHAYFCLGKVYQSQQLYKESIQQFLEFLRRLENPEAHYELGRSYMWIGSYAEAIEEYTVYIDMKRHINLDTSVFILRAEAYEAIDRLDLSRKDYEMVLKLNPNFYAPYLEYAQDLADAGMFYESKSILEFVRSKNTSMHS